VRDPQLPRQRVRPLAVNGREVDRLRAAAHVRRHLLERNLEDGGRRLAVNVTTAHERGDERRIV